MELNEFVEGYFETIGSDRFPRETAEADLKDIYQRIGRLTNEQVRGVYYAYTIGTISGRKVGALESSLFAF